MSPHFRILPILMLLICQFSRAAEVTTGRVIHIQYASTSWNTDPTQIESATVILRDRTTGKIVQIQLEETAPDSSQFTGRFSVSLREEAKLSPEIYIPPQHLRGGEKDYKKLYDMIQSGELQRKPLIWKKNERGQEVLDVYDTREEAEAGLKAYDDEQKAALELKKQKPLKPMSNADAAVAAAAAAKKAQLEKEALEAAQRAADRVRMEQIERQKAAEREEAARRMSEEQRAERKAKAERLNAEALELYNAGDFKAAEPKFKQAVDLDPDNRDYYYKYGVTLYRNQKFNEALVALKIGNVDPSLESEKKYFMGLVHYRLSELDNALHQFQDVAKSNDPNLVPSALFYEGIILFELEKYDTAKKMFEKVIDSSKDPKIDDQAEAYLDRIAAAMQFQKLRENKFTLTGTVGVMYDSNVLLTPDELPGGGKPSGSADFRLLTLADLQYRPIFNEHYEFTPHATVNLTNSAKNSSAPGDPYIYTLAAPFSFKGELNKKANKLTLTPGYEVLFMDPEDTGTKTEQLSSYYLTLDDTYVVNKDWVSVYTLEYRNDYSLDPSSIGPNNWTSNKYTLRTNQTFFLDKSRKQSLTPTLDFIRNNALGTDWTYSRYDIGATYVQPIAWDCSWSAGLTYYNQTFAGQSPQRIDKDYLLSTGVSKPIRDWVVWGLSGTYTKNESTDTTYTYTKYVILTTATFLTNF